MTNTQNKPITHLNGKGEKSCLCTDVPLRELDYRPHMMRVYECPECKKVFYNVKVTQ